MPDRVIAFTEGQGVKFDRVPDGLQKIEEPNPLDIVDSPDLPPLWLVFGGKKRADGHWVSALNSWRNSLHPMPHCTSVLSTSSWRPPGSILPPTWWVPTSCKCGRGTSCSSRAGRWVHSVVDGEAVRGASSTVGVRLSLYDEGNGGRMITSASAVFEDLLCEPACLVSSVSGREGEAA